MSIPVRYLAKARTADGIVNAVEHALTDQAVLPGDRLPTVRQLAEDLGVAPGTVATAYRRLAERGIVTGAGRSGTHISAGPALPVRPAAPVPEGVVNLTEGTPDPRLLPDLRAVLRRTEHVLTRYQEAEHDVARLVELATTRLQDDGIPAERVAVVGGALDGVERVLQAHLRPGDRVAVEDPGFPRVFDLCAALGLTVVPVPLDERGMTADGLAAALRNRATAVVLTPRAQNPTGAALDTGRARELRRVLRTAPATLVVEDDHAGPIAGAPARTVVTGELTRWAVVRSVAKSLGPDLRLAVLTGDRTTVDRVEGRLRLGTGWVSHLLQDAVVALWSDPATADRIAAAEQRYTERREALVAALADHDIGATGVSGLNVWVPVPAEDAVIRGLLARGWAVAGGERFRLRSAPAIRVTTACLSPAHARHFAADLAATLRPAPAHLAY